MDKKERSEPVYDEAINLALDAATELKNSAISFEKPETAYSALANLLRVAGDLETRRQDYKRQSNNKEEKADGKPAPETGITSSQILQMSRRAAVK